MTDEIIFIALASLMRKRQAFILAFTLITIVLSSRVRAQQPDTVKIASQTDSVYDNPNFVFVKSEVEASVSKTEWRRHLEKNLIPVIEAAARAGIKPGVYVISVRFIVEKDGSISDVRALNDVGFGLAEGAIRVVRTGPKWEAGEQNGRKIRSYHTQPISFGISTQR